MSPRILREELRRPTPARRLSVRAYRHSIANSVQRIRKVVRHFARLDRLCWEPFPLFRPGVVPLAATLRQELKYIIRIEIDGLVGELDFVKSLEIVEYCVVDISNRYVADFALIKHHRNDSLAVAEIAGSLSVLFKFG